MNKAATCRLVDILLLLEVARSGREPGLCPPLAGVGSGDGLCLVLVAGRVGAARARAHSTTTTGHYNSKCSDRSMEV